MKVSKKHFFGLSGLVERLSCFFGSVVSNRPLTVFIFVVFMSSLTFLGVIQDVALTLELITNILNRNGIHSAAQCYATFKLSM